MSADLEIINVDDSQVYRYLYSFCRGKSKAIKADALARQFNTTRRDINDEISKLRRAGALIGSSRQDPFGYFIPNCREETQEFMAAYRGEMKAMLMTYNRMKRAQRTYLDSKTQDSWKLQFDTATGQMELCPR